MDRGLHSRKRRIPLIAAALGCLTAACQRQAKASEEGRRSAGCVSGTLLPGRPLAGTLDDSGCPRRDGGAYVDYAMALRKGEAYLVRVAARPDTTRRHHHDAAAYDAVLLGGGERELLAGTPVDARAPGHSASQLLFIAPDSGRYVVRVRARDGGSAGAFTIVARACGGGRLGLRLTRRATLGPASCIERLRFGADSGYVDLWTLHLKPEERVRVRVASASRQPLYIRIRGPGLAGDESNGDVDRLVFKAQQGGDYTVLVGQTAFDPRPSRYTIRADDVRG